MASDNGSRVAISYCAISRLAGFGSSSVSATSVSVSEVPCFGTLVERASELLAQLSLPMPEAPEAKISATELAQTVARTISIPEIAALRPRLIPEHTIFQSQIEDGVEIIVSGIADAVAYDEEGKVEVVIDWKSDVVMDSSRLNSYLGQLDAYRRHTGAKRSLLVFMTPGKVISS